MQNIRKMDKINVDMGVIRIGFIEPETDLVIMCNPKELKFFVETVEVVSTFTALNIGRLQVCKCRRLNNTELSTWTCQESHEVCRSLLLRCYTVSQIFTTWYIRYILNTTLIFACAAI